MKKLSIAFVPCAVAAGLVIASGLSASAQTLSLQLQAANYNPTTGVWADTSGNNDTATYSGTSMPTLAAGVTPNGSSAVHFGGQGILSLASSIGVGGGSYTAFAFLQPAAGAGPYALFGGTGYGSFEYRIYNGHQDSLLEWQADLGSGIGTLSSSSFSLIDATVSSSGGGYRLNGAADGTTAGTTFTAPITFIGNNYNVGGGEAFSGYISEIDIYSGVLSPTQISTVEAQLTTQYVIPEPTSLAMVVSGLGLLFATRRFRRTQA
jgi:hypothetical protein